MNDPRNRTDLPHPADILAQDCQPCPTTPVGFTAKVKYISTLAVSEIIDAPSNNKLRTEGEVTATSLISQADADAKALALAKENARQEMEFYIERNYPPRGEWIV